MFCCSQLTSFRSTVLPTVDSTVYKAVVEHGISQVFDIESSHCAFAVISLLQTLVYCTPVVQSREIGRYLILADCVASTQVAPPFRVTPLLFFLGFLLMVWKTGPTSSYPRQQWKSNPELWFFFLSKRRVQPKHIGARVLTKSTEDGSRSKP